jgi:hypothetical protein
LESAHNFPALRFAAASSYLPSTPEALRRQRELLCQSLESGLPPDRVWEQICRHRTFALSDQVLSRHGLRSALGQHDSVLAKSARQAQLQALTLGAEAGRFSGLLASHGISHRLLKGTQVSKKLYGDAGLRHSRDIDLIVEPCQLMNGLKVLKAASWDWPNAAPGSQAALIACWRSRNCGTWKLRIPTASRFSKCIGDLSTLPIRQWRQRGGRIGMPTPPRCLRRKRCIYACTARATAGAG